MFKPIYCFVLITALLALSCQQRLRTEQEEKTYWRARAIDSAFSLLYALKDTSAALAYFDAATGGAARNNAFVKANRFDLVANYFYFYAADNAITARYIDSSLGMLKTTELQHRFPRTYVGFLLFGGNLAYRLFQYSKANDYYFRAKKLADAYLDPCERTSFNYNIAMVLYRQENFEQSLRHFSEAYRLQSTCPLQTSAVVLQQQEIQSNIGLCYIQLQKYDSATHHFQQALGIADRYRDSLGPRMMEIIYGVVYGNLGKVAMVKNELDKASQLSLQSIALNDREGYDIENADGVKLQLAQIYNLKNDLPRMGAVLAGFNAKLKDANRRTQLEWNRLQAAYHEHMSQADSALYFLKSYALLDKAISEEQKRLTDADVIRQLTDKENELHIAVLKKDKQLTLVSLWVIITISVLTLVILYLIYQNYRRSKKSLAVSLALNEEIRQQKAAREEEARQRHKLITEAVIRAQENERSAIGLELHDNVNQVLTTVKLHNEMVLEGMGDPKVLLPRAIGYLQNCIHEIRSLSRRLSAPTLGKISLEESVKDLIDSINVAGKVKIRRQIKGLDKNPLKKELHIGVYRILQEQLNNVLKHADASEVAVRLEQQNDQLFLLVEDNGKGFAMNHNSGGIGLMNMQTRAENLNGTFELVSRPGNGCRLKVVLPCPLLVQGNN